MRGELFLLAPCRVGGVLVSVSSLTEFDNELDVPVVPNVEEEGICWAP